MAEKFAARRPEAPAAMADFISLGARAFVSGIVVALVLGFAAVVLAGNADAASVPVPHHNGPRSAAPAPTRSSAAHGVGALWATAEQPDAPAALHVLLGLLALGAAGLVALVGRARAPRKLA